MALEYKPFTRFTLAKALNDTTSGKLSEFLNMILRNRSTGCFIIGPKNISSKIDNNFLIKLSTAITHLFGNPNYDSMAGKYYARFHVKHEDNSDSYLRKGLYKFRSSYRWYFCQRKDRLVTHDKNGGNQC